VHVLPCPHIKCRTDGRGFTLIELLVVIAIAAILVTIAVMSFNLIGDDRAVQKQVIKLSTLIDMASDEAQIQGRDYGLEFMQGGYRFVEYDPFLEVWSEVIGDDLLQPRALDEDMIIDLFLEDHRVLLQAEAKDTDSDEDEGNRDLTDDYLPHVLIMASGDITPFRLDIVRLTDELAVGLKIEFGGDLEIVRHDQEF
jgi:general secretion pathway protein H